MQLILLLKIIFSAMYDNSQLSFEKQNEGPSLICKFADRWPGGGVFGEGCAPPLLKNFGIIEVPTRKMVTTVSPYFYQNLNRYN